MNTLFFLIHSIFDFYVILFVLRFWLFSAKVIIYSPLIDIVYKLTDPLLKLTKKLKLINKNQIFTLLIIIYCLVFIKLLLLNSIGYFSVPIHDLLFLAIFASLKKIGTVVFLLLFIYAIISWILPGNLNMMYTLQAMADYILKPVRGVIPLFKGIDLSVLFVLLILQTLNLLAMDIVGSMWVAV